MPNITARSKQNSVFQPLSGPSYSISSRQPKYHLPPPTTLRPYKDTAPGGIDTWPSNRASQFTQLPRPSDKTKDLLPTHEDLKTQLTPKPKFLEQLEEFLKKELKNLGVTSVVPSQLRLQAHREVFDYLIEDFKTYKPLLSAIKNEYELVLADQRETIRQLEPLRQMLVTASEEFDQRVMGIRDQEKEEIIALRAEKAELMSRLAERGDHEAALRAQVERLQEELAAEYLRYRDQCDARKLLLADINELRYQQNGDAFGAGAMSLHDLEPGAGASEEKDDPVTLKIALRKAREDETVATRKLNEMIANYGDVIPRRDYEALQTQYQSLEEKLITLKADFNTLTQDHTALVTLKDQVVRQRDDFYVECERLRRSATPRPDWDKAADFIDGGIVKWKELAEGRSSDQKVDILLNQMSGGAVPGTGDPGYFDAQGINEKVPKYLRTDEAVRKRHLGKRDCALMIRDIWREKVAHDAEKDGKREKLSEYLFKYLSNRFGLEKMVIEWGYNLHDACQRYSHDERIGLFASVLMGEADEALFHHQNALIQRLYATLSRADTEQGVTEGGTLPRDLFRSALADFHEGRLADDVLDSLLQAATTELDSRVEQQNIEYRNLFSEDDEGKTGAFLDEIKKIEREKRVKYVDEIKAALDGTSPVTVEELKRAFTLVDPQIDQVSLDNYVSWAFRLEDESSEQPASTQAEEIQPLINRLLNGDISRVGAPS